MHSPIIMELNGMMNSKTDIPKAIRFGTRASGGMPVGEKFAQVKLPKLYTAGAKLIIL